MAWTQLVGSAFASPSATAVRKLLQGTNRDFPWEYLRAAEMAVH